MTSRYAALSREELATLVPELLLIGQLIDRSGMAHCISAWGRDEMLQIAIEEWAASSPLYTRRMQKALNYEGVDIFTLFTAGAAGAAVASRLVTDAARGRRVMAVGALVLVVGVGLSFVSPLVLIALNAVGVLSGRTIVRGWRVALVVIIVAVFVSKRRSIAVSDNPEADAEAMV